MSVKPSQLENPERDLTLTTRETAEAKATRRQDDPAAAELKALRERHMAVKAMTPKDPAPHCGACFRRGWAAAMRAIEE